MDKTYFGNFFIDGELYGTAEFKTLQVGKDFVAENNRITSAEIFCGDKWWVYEHGQWMAYQDVSTGGEIADEDWEDEPHWSDRIDTDECGYNPYMGCNDWDC
jgi:hypothetical protein